MSSFEKLTFTGGPVGLPSQEGNHALVSVEGHAVRFRVDGGDPSLDTGHRIKNQPVMLEGTAEIKNFRIISEGTSTLQITYDTRASR